MACPRCGSWSVRADRSLAGRMVCGRCGTPLQGVSRAAAGGRGRQLQGWPRRLRPRWQAGAGRHGAWRWWLLVLLALSAAFASLSPNPSNPLRPDAPADRPDHRWQ